MAATKSPPNKSKRKGAKFLVFVILLGLLICLVWKYRYLIKGWFSGGNSTNGPSGSQVTTIIQSGGGGSTPNPTNPADPQGSYWPLKKGSKNEHVRWVQIMLNKIPNTGATLLEDGNWGSKTEAKFNAAKSIFGYTVNEISYMNYLKMFCYTWPNSETCRQINQSYPNL